jgi:hypothetical protein
VGSRCEDHHARRDSGRRRRRRRRERGGNGVRPQEVAELAQGRAYRGQEDQCRHRQQAKPPVILSRGAQGDANGCPPTTRVEALGNDDRQAAAFFSPRDRAEAGRKAPVLEADHLASSG